MLNHEDSAPLLLFIVTINLINKINLIKHRELRRVIICHVSNAYNPLFNFDANKRLGSLQVYWNILGFQDSFFIEVK